MAYLHTVTYLFQVQPRWRPTHWFLMTIRNSWAIHWSSCGDIKICECEWCVCVCVCTCACVESLPVKRGWQGTYPLHFESVKTRSMIFLSNSYLEVLVQLCVIYCTEDLAKWVYGLYLGEFPVWSSHKHRFRLLVTERVAHTVSSLLIWLKYFAHGFTCGLLERAWANPTLASQTVDFSYNIICYISSIVRDSVNASWLF